LLYAPMRSFGRKRYDLAPARIARKTEVIVDMAGLVAGSTRSRMTRSRLPTETIGEFAVPSRDGDQEAKFPLSYDPQTWALTPSCTIILALSLVCSARNVAAIISIG